MNFTECQEERIAIMAEGSKISQAQAEKVFLTNFITDKSMNMALEAVMRLKISRMKPRRSGKSLASGE
jgi:hypothetical protein